MDIFLNLTQHRATPEQDESGVFDLTREEREELVELLTFDSLPRAGEVRHRAAQIVRLALRNECVDFTHVMLGGAPFLMGELQEQFQYEGIRVVYAYSKRDVVETTMPDGGVKKVAVFRHLGFVEAEVPA